MLASTETWIQVTGEATVALALVGAISIIANTVLAFFTGKMANATGKAAQAAEDGVKLQREELNTLTRQLELMSKQVDVAVQEREEATRKALRDARVELDFEMSGGQHRNGAPPIDVRTNFAVSNKGPGMALTTRVGVQRLGIHHVIREGLTLQPGERYSSPGMVAIPDELFAGVAMGVDPRSVLEGWAEYSDALGQRWRVVQAPGQAPTAELIGGDGPAA